MSARAKKEKRDLLRLPGLILRALLALAAALAVSLACGYLIYYINTELTLPTRARVLIELSCLAGIAASLLLARAYIKSLIGPDEG